MNILKQSTQIVVRVGPFMDATDAVTPETGITLGAADQAEALKAAGAATVDISAATWAAITGADGWYDLTLTTSHTDTIGELAIVVQDTSVCLPVWTRFQVVEEAIYDALFGASAAGFDANGRTDVGSWLGTAVTTSATSTKPEVDVNSISDSATAANNLEASALGVVSTAVNDASASTTAFVTDLTEASDDHYIGRIIVFTSGALAGQATDITDYAGATKTVTVTALTEAPADNDTFVIV